MASELGRGAQVRLDGEARRLARGGVTGRLIDSILAKRALEDAGTVADGNRPDGSSANGTAAEDEVLVPGGDVSLVSQSYTPVGGGVTASTLSVRALETGVSLKTDFGAKGDGVTSDQTAIAAFFAYLKANGGIGYIPAGTYLQTNFIQIFDGAKPFKVIGAGRDVVTIKRAASVGTPFDIRRTHDLTFEGITFDAGNDALPTNSNHGISVLDCNRVRFNRCRVKNYKNTAILYYVTVQNVIEGGVYDDLEVDGMGVANNGAYFEGTDRCSMRGVKVKGCPGSPGYGLQLKNNCRYASMDDCLVESCTGGVSFGQQSGATEGGASYTRVNGITIRNCSSGIIAGYGDNDVIEGVMIDMGNTGNHAIDLQNCTNISVSGIVTNVAAGKTAVRLTNTTDSLVSVDVADLPNATSFYASFVTGSARNTVRYGRVVGQASDTPLSTTRLADTSGQAGNSVEFGDGVWTLATNTIRSVVGVGTPEGVVTARIGSQYRRIDGGAGSVLYLKESGTGSSGWRAV